MDLATLTTILTLSTTPELPTPKPTPKPAEYRTSYVQPGNKDHQVHDLEARYNPILQPYKN